MEVPSTRNPEESGAQPTKPAPLTPEELEAVQLRCVVCGSDVPRGRATRRKDTCTVECYDKLKQWRKHLQGQRKCNTCLAPYTDKQRAEFRLWRQETGGLRVKRGKPPIARERKLENAVTSLIVALTGALSWPLRGDTPGPHSDEVYTYIRVLNAGYEALGIDPKFGFEVKPVDTAPPESNSISADQPTI